MKRTILTLIALAGAAACSKDVELLEQTVTPIDRSGGTARSADGRAALTFASGSLAEETEISVRTRRDRTAPRLRSLVYELGPDGLAFPQPVTLSISAADTSKRLVIANLDGPQPVIVPGTRWDPATKTVSAPLVHFSSYGALEEHDPCAGLACGDSCSLCDPLDPACTVDSTGFVCNRAGGCVEPAHALCGGDPDGGLPDAIVVEDRDGLINDTFMPFTPDAGLWPDAEESPIDGGDRTCGMVFRQNSQPVVDVLLVVDDTGSMADEQAALATAFPVLLQSLSGADFHIGVITTDVQSPAKSGRLQGTPQVLTSSTPDLAQAFAQNVAVGIDGSAIESGLEAMRRALTEPLLSTDNAGFLRPEASLAVVIVSDEDDASPDPATTYAGLLLSLRGPGRVLFNTLVGDVPGGCATAAAGTRYDVLRAAFGGTFESICSPPWSQALDVMAGGSFGYRSRFRFRTPTAEVIRSVTVNGVEVPERTDAGAAQWTYDPVTQTIEFSESAIPEPGATIIAYIGC